MFTRRHWIFASFALALTACSSALIPSDARTTIIALRHADRDGEHLNEIGKARANALPAALQAYEIDAIFAPNIERNLETAAPLSRATDIPVTKIPTDNVAGQMTTTYPDGTVVWVGNKSNLTPLWEELNAPGEPPLEYGELFVVELKSLGQRKVTRLYFGE